MLDHPDKTTKTSTLKTSAGTTIVSLKVTLRGAKPPIWRRLLVPSTMMLGDLHLAIQAAMGWGDCHLHAFDIVDDVAEENRLTLSSLLKSGVDRFTYTYDFGDDWEHTVAIEKAQPAVDGEAYPRCVAGKGACPPEDCGGPWGYQHLLEVLADHTHPEYADQRTWVGEDFTPDHFDTVGANAVLSARFGRK
jgi:hypothetical protein